MKLLELYAPLVGLVLFGWWLGRKLPKAVGLYLGRLLYWLGVPISIVAFLRQADLSGPIWLAPAIAWLAILLGAGLAWLWMRLAGASTHSTRSSLLTPHPFWSQPTQGSFLLASMVGNTGYLGYPIALAIAGTKYFGWALFYDLLGSTFGAYGLGVALAAGYGKGFQERWSLVKAILINPALWSFGFGLAFRQIPLPEAIEAGLHFLAWTTVAFSLVLIGMRLSQLNSWHNLPRAGISLTIKMLLVPLILGSSLSLFGLSGPIQLVMVLQMAMPPAFATLVIAEEYNLDRDLSVTTLAVGAIALLVLLPIWIRLF